MVVRRKKIIVTGEKLDNKLSEQQAGRGQLCLIALRLRSNLPFVRMRNCPPETLRDQEMKRPNYSINAPIGTPVCATEPNIWCVRVEEAWEASERRAAPEPRPCGVWTWEMLQPWSMPCFLPLGQFPSGGEHLASQEALPSLAQGSVGSPWQRDSSRVQGELGSWAPAFCPGSPKPEAVVAEEEPPRAPPQLVLQQPHCIWDPKQGSPTLQAQTSEPGHTGQSSQPAASSWWRAGPIFSALLEWLHCPVLSFPPGCCPAAFGLREP